MITMKKNNPLTYIQYLSVSLTVYIYIYIYIKLSTPSHRMQGLLECKEQDFRFQIEVSLTQPSGNVFSVLYTAFSQREQRLMLTRQDRAQTVCEPSILPACPLICSQTDLSLMYRPTGNLSFNYDVAFRGFL